MSAPQDIFRQILHLPGVVGALTYDAQGAVLASSFPEPFEARELQRVSRLLSEDFLVHQALEGTKGGVDLRYTGGRLILRPFSRGAILALCTTTANAQLVNLGLVQAIHRLEKAEPEAEPEPEPRAKAQESPPRLAGTEWAKPGALVGLKEAFLVRIGPIGELLFSRFHAKWSADAEARTQGLWGFAAALAKEIDDPADQRAFIHDARNIIG